MKTSESIAGISKALTKAWGDISNPTHNQKVKVRMKSGGQYEFEYTDLGGILDEVKPHFKEHGISIIQHAYTEIIDGKSFISVVTKLLHSSGEWIESRPLQIIANNRIQEMGGQITYLKRYSLSAILGISTEEDDDANMASGNQAELQKKPEKQVSRSILLAKWKTGGGNEEQFNEWYAKQSSQGHTNNEMDRFLTKELMKRGKDDANAQTSS